MQWTLSVKLQVEITDCSLFFFLQLVNCSREQRLVQQVKGDKNDDNDDSKEEERTQYHHS